MESILSFASRILIVEFIFVTEISEFREEPRFCYFEFLLSCIEIFHCLPILIFFWQGR
ncbi:hypothetical protein K450DRAFT_234113 [Umbelopsis ramanniana AG]|uniref:Uncharacterized protein n=1 Tax=Umbelopsis ramanniana AG TaxID=1314678 RepID=A0AAD5HGF1_UMBRA|nr:uncharacterized protein K450DRAFT_234113 [Umbelopsis ramanniana AG]KAI8580998.1 hypothetical protein K450DRAFT_234113 [Umbelopsis ramanniana AG]